MTNRPPRPSRKPLHAKKIPNPESRIPNPSSSPCPVSARCGGCQLMHLSYADQLRRKQQAMEKLLSRFCPVDPILGMDDPTHYRGKVHVVLAEDRKGKVISGVYAAGTHHVVPVESCLRTIPARTPSSAPSWR